MNAQLLGRIFGPSGNWHGACTVILDAEASVQSMGADAIMTGGVKSYAPRLISGRILADAVQWLPEESVLLVVQQQKFKQTTGEDAIKNTLLLIEALHVVALEFSSLEPLKSIGVAVPKIQDDGMFRPGMLVG